MWLSALLIAVLLPLSSVGAQPAIAPVDDETTNLDAIGADIRAHEVTVNDLETVNATDYQPLIAGRATSAIWMSERVALVIEDETTADRNPTHMASILTRFDQMFMFYDAMTGITPASTAGLYEGRARVEVSTDVGGGLAGHDRYGIAIGFGFFEDTYGRTVNGDTSFEQIYFYETARNYWSAQLNPRIDYHTSVGPADWGWWTVGFNNAMACFVSEEMGVELYYFGYDREWFCENMRGHHDEYVAGNGYTWENSWNVNRLPWSEQTSLNDLMTGTLVHLHDEHGGADFIARLYRAVLAQPELPGRDDYQGARDNLYRAASLAASADLTTYFSDTLKWDLSDEAVASVRQAAANGWPETFAEVGAWQLPDVQAGIDRIPGRNSVAPAPMDITGTWADAAGSQTAHVSVVDITGVRHYWNGASFGRTETSVPVAVGPDGTWTLEDVTLAAGHRYRVRVHGLDGLGNVSPTTIVAKARFTAAGDRPLGPQLAISSPGRRADAGTTVVTGTAHDPDGVRVVHVLVINLTDGRTFWNGTSFQEGRTRVRAILANDGTWSVPGVELESGTRYLVKVRSVDELGNVTRTRDTKRHVIRTR